MSWRQFIGLLVAAMAWPLAVRAQPAPPVCGSIGVAVRPMSEAFAQSLGMTAPYGAIFDQPRPGSPAAKAGIERYDVVTAIEACRLGAGAILRRPSPGWRPARASISPHGETGN